MSGAGRPGNRTMLVAVVAIGGLLALGAAAVGLAYLFLRSPAPAPVGAATSPPGAASALPTPRMSGATRSLAPVGGLSGTWTIDPSIGSFADFSSSFVGYRVNETFTGNRANTAVGRTPNVQGSLQLDGTTISSVDVTADLTTLRSDDERRDGQLSRQAIQTSQFPAASFRLTTPLELGAVPADGGQIRTTASGELTLHGVTRAVQVPVTATLAGDVVTVTGSLDIAFADYGISQPTSFLVLSIEDHGVMEFQLHFRHG